MSISSEITRISQNVSDSLTAVASKGVTVPSGANSDDLPTLIASIQTGGGGTPAISVVDTTDSHGGTVREITALDISDTTAIASVVQSPYWFYTAEGVKTQGTASGGGAPSATQHSIYFEFTDNTNTTITAYYDDSFISNAITATTPTTYGSKTVTLAQLDGTTWYSYSPSPEIWETLQDGSTNVNPDTPYNLFWLSSLSNVYPIAGDVYRITIDSSVYRCTATLNGQTVTVGNPKYSGGTDDGSNVPFNFYNAGWGAWAGDTELTTGSYYVKIEHLITS